MWFDCCLVDWSWRFLRLLGGLGFIVILRVFGWFIVSCVWFTIFPGWGCFVCFVFVLVTYLSLVFVTVVWWVGGLLACSDWVFVGLMYGVWGSFWLVVFVC